MVRKMTIIEEMLINECWRYKVHPQNNDKSSVDVKWREILILWIIVIACFWLLCSCAGNRNKKCKVYDGNGYYQKKIYVFCDSTREYDSDKDPYKSYKKLYGD